MQRNLYFAIRQKFNKISKATFAAGSDITVITDKITENIKGYNIKEAAQL